MATLKDRYKSEIAPKLKEELSLDNVMEVPKITKITTWWITKITKIKTSFTPQTTESDHQSQFRGCLSLSLSLTNRHDSRL